MYYWEQLGTDITGETLGDESGYSVSLNADGSRVAIGARYNVGPGVEDIGQVRVYQWNSTISTWQKLGSDIDGEDIYEQSGYSVSLSADGNIVAIDAIYNSDNGEAAGQVRIYQWNGSSWNKLGSNINGEDAYDRTNIVSLSADTE